MVGFYIAIGVVATLVVAAALLWKPLQAYRWETQLRKNAATGLSVCATFTLADGTSGFAYSTPQEAIRLCSIGPASAPAFRRLMRSPDQAVKISAALALGEADKWGLPILLEAASDADDLVALQAIRSAERLAKRQFAPGQYLSHQPAAAAAAGRRALREWWEAEGRAEHGR